MAIANVYNILAFRPALEKKHLPKNLRPLADRLVASGKIRISSDEGRNFVTFASTYNNYHEVFSRKELFDSKLIPATKNKIAALLGNNNKQEVEDRLAELRDKARRLTHITPERENKLALLLMQAAEPSVIELLLREKSEVFISYSHDISDLVSIKDWHGIGKAGGLQKNSEIGSAVYISCMGDPLLPEEYRTYTSDGFPAMARLLVIGGQELGHYADVRRDGQGSRFSLDGHRFRAHPAVKKARDLDMKNMKTIIVRLTKTRIGHLANMERNVEFLRKHQKNTNYMRWHILKAWVYKSWIKLIRGRDITFLKAMPRRLYDSEEGRLRYFGKAVVMAARDMEFNLNPKGYERPDPTEYEAMLCVEALARIPQQVIKWGHPLTKVSMPNLYKIYYGQVIPACEAIIKPSGS